LKRKKEKSMAGMWSKPVGGTGSDGPDYWDYFGGKLVEYASIYPGAKVLDVGCGSGSSLFPAAEKAGPKGYVVGIDICTCPN
jgi:O-methyltransferase/aklanonic acid methyltransferase